jgi:hypothetical protein
MIRRGSHIFLGTRARLRHIVCVELEGIGRLLFVVRFHDRPAGERAQRDAVDADLETVATVSELSIRVRCLVTALDAVFAK